MTNSQRLANVRARFQRWLVEQDDLDLVRNGFTDTLGDAGESGNVIVRESILIRNEFYCGRRFHATHYQAVWFIEEDELKIYDLQGNLQCVLSGEQLNAPTLVESEESAHILKLPLASEHEGRDRENRDNDQARRAA